MINKDSKIRVLSGIRASHSSLHIGNLLGAIEGMKKLQEDPRYETFYMVADLHAITTPFKPEELRKNRIAIAVDYLAAGIDPEKSVLFLQADVSEHAEFSYYLSSVVKDTRVHRLPSYKDKKKEDLTVAALNYPVLMAADILLYKAKRVPIGDDQLPHLEIAREIVRTMNKEYHTNFPEPKQFRTSGHAVPSLLGKGKKMSKSVKGSAINLLDDLVTIKKKLLKIPTDKGKGQEIPKGGGVATLLTLVELFQGKDRKRKYEKQYKGSGIRYKKLKEELAGAIYSELESIQTRRRKLEKNPEYVERILKEGAKKAREVARGTLKETKRAMGLSS